MPGSWLCLQEGIIWSCTVVCMSCRLPGNPSCNRQRQVIDAKTRKRLKHSSCNSEELPGDVLQQSLAERHASKVLAKVGENSIGIGRGRTRRLFLFWEGGDDYYFRQ